jgi:Flp pilus assembly protein TadG
MLSTHARSGSIVKLRNEGGQIAIGFALLMLFVFMVFAVAIDTGVWYLDHRVTQN